MKVSFRRMVFTVIVFSTLISIYQIFTEQHQLIDISHEMLSNPMQYKSYSFEYYFEEILSWCSSPNSFCIENYHNRIHSKDSSIVILSISNFNGGIIGHLWSASQDTKEEFIFYLRLSRILYANKYRYKYCEFQETFDRTRPPQWSKYNALRMVSTLHNVQHIIWMDIDAIFHSYSRSIEQSPLFNISENKLMILTQSQDFEIANLGCFMVNNIQPKLNEFLDLLEYITVKQDIKTYGSTFEQRAMNFLFHYNKTIFDKYCVKLPRSKEVQLFHGPQHHYNLLKNKYSFLVWHWTGIKQRYTKMIFSLKQEISLFMYQQNISQSKDMFERYFAKYNLGKSIANDVDHPFEPEWIKSVKICKSKKWSDEKSMELLGKVYGEEEIRQRCGKHTHIAWNATVNV
eukprot:133214_1